MFLRGMTALWVAKGIEDCLELNCHEGFFRELRMGNGVFSIQHHVNARGSFLQFSEFRNGRRKGLLVIPEGANDIGWKDFLQFILSVNESKATFRSGEFVDGKIVGRPSSIKGASYAAVLRSLAGSQAKISSAVERKGIALVGDKRPQVTLRELEGVL
ncbi:uncharacterized protein LOC121265470 [Juglans microcarpa x Juglans regia]|uniref:uncharacterized protein LOC121265470 n=1 Tax=Juglans microcarpa x Juglans regia TaxID=2249226 RepID=UPI001B7E0589|nr:uncharacterized protein LOC121265470 [Juglans microcarpa x Juglans regia]